MVTPQASADPRDLKRGRIVEAAAQVFASKGFDGSRIADIAFAAGIGKGTVYEYFSTKEDLFFAVFESWIDEMYAALDKTRTLGESKGSSQTLLAYTSTSMTFFDQAKELTPLWVEFWAAASTQELQGRFREEFRRIYRRFRDLIGRSIEEGIRKGEFREDVKPRAVAAALVGVYDGLTLQAWFEPGLRAKEVASELVGHLIRGMQMNRRGNR